MKVRNVKISTVFLSIVLMILGFIIIKNPSITFNILSKVVGLYAFFKGIMLLVMFFKLKDIYIVKANTSIVFGILLIIFGILFFTRPSVMATMLTYIISIWFIILSIVGFNFSVFYKNKNKYILNMILNLLLIFGSIVILFNPKAVSSSFSVLLGLLLIIDGAISILFTTST